MLGLTLGFGSTKTNKEWTLFSRGLPHKERQECVERVMSSHQRWEITRIERKGAQKKDFLKVSPEALLLKVTSIAYQLELC